MNKLLVFLFVTICCNNVFAQSIYPYEEIRLEKPSDFKDAAPLALSAASFLLSTPFKKNDKDRQRAVQFLSNWMTGTKEYHFSMPQIMLESADDHDLLGIFIAALAKFCLENKTVSSNARLVEKGVSKLVLDYCNDVNNNFTLKKKIRKRLEAN